jgi:nitronate monooxygenase
MSRTLDRLAAPVVLAPLAGGPSTPELTAAVCDAGGLGFLASGYLSAAETESKIAAARKLTSGPFGVNLFVPGDGARDPALYSDYLARLRVEASAAGVDLGDPRYSDDDWTQKLELLLRDPVAVVSFAFGCPAPETLRSLKGAGSETWVTVTSPDEARRAMAAGADALVLQGSEAGGHRASFADEQTTPAYGLLALLQLVRATVALPLVASGGIAGGAGLLAAIALGASAAQIGTAFMLCPEAGTAEAHRTAIATDAPTELTRAFTGRLARGIRNRFLVEHRGAPTAYPEIHYATAPMRGWAREHGDAEHINLWAGETHALARPEPAGRVVERIVREAGPLLAPLRASATAAAAASAGAIREGADQPT